MGLRRLQRKRHTEAKEEHSPHPAPDTTATRAPHAVMETALQTNIVQLQRLIGNHRVQRLLSDGYISRKTGLIQRDPDTPAASPPPAPAAVEDQAPPTAGEPEEIVIEQGMYLGGEELHNKALPKNQYYASHPPKPGWPFTPELKALWDAGQYNDFADEVAAYQHFTLKLPEGQVDGILGPKTSRSLAGNQAESPPGAPSPAAETTTSDEPAPAGSTATTTADDPAVSGHPAVGRILNPVKQAFKTYKETEDNVKAAERAVSKAKKAEKAAKEEERQIKMGKMEESRNAARAVMATAREQVAALTEAEFPGGAAEMQRVKAYLNRQLNAHTIFYAQGMNANILYRDKTAAAGRTCNMTVMSMMLEALGKSAKDYTGDLTRLQSLAGEYNDVLGKNNTSPEDLTSLRLPDFLQLVAIDMTGSRDKAAASITSHGFITDVARSFGLKVVDIKGEERKNKKGEHERFFLSTKFTSKLDAIGVLYRPAESEAYKALKDDATYKGLEGDEKKAYAKQFVAAATEKRRLQFIANVDAWTDIDNQAKTQLEALQAEFGQPNPTDSAKPRFFDTKFQAKADEVIKGLQDIATAVPKEHKGRQNELKAMIATLNKAISADRKKPDKPPQKLAALFDGKGKDDPIKQLENNIKK
ncbi:MAG TPA: hypothetical protein VKY59_21300, partial [Spirillospora sp.]|nr:hypothetical protein [Spirillospora sp.]